MWTTPSGTGKAPADGRIDDIRSRPADFRVLERVPHTMESVPFVLGERRDSDTVVTFLDTETTGLNPHADRIIELGMARCRYGSDGRLVEISDVFAGFDDPGVPIPPQVTRLTGITDGDVRGERLDARAVEEWLGGDPLVVAHNAKFDRPFFERRFPELGGYRWACSLQGIPWYEMGYASSSLPLLLVQEGWFYEAHRACDDCLAVSWMLHMVPGALDGLVRSAGDMTMVVAGGKTYPVREKLKARGYGFDGTKKHWTKTVPPDDADREADFLYGMKQGGMTVSRTRVTARTAFK